VSEQLRTRVRTAAHSTLVLGWVVRACFGGTQGTRGTGGSRTMFGLLELLRFCFAFWLPFLRWLRWLQLPRRSARKMLSVQLSTERETTTVKPFHFIDHCVLVSRLALLLVLGWLCAVWGQHVF
jgi:hypothetical protein